MVSSGAGGIEAARHKKFTLVPEPAEAADAGLANGKMISTLNRVGLAPPSFRPLDLKS